MRKLGPFLDLTVDQTFDVVWFKVPFPDFWPDAGTVRLELGAGHLSGGIPASDGSLQTGFTIWKGAFRERHARGTERWTDDLIARLSPEMIDHLTMHRAATRYP